MEQQYLIDSNAAIDYLSGKLPEAGMKFMNSVINDFPKISVITKIEVLSFNTDPTAYLLLEEFINSCIILDLNDEIISGTISIRKNNKIKTPDAIIAATVNFLILSNTLCTKMSFLN